MSSESERDTTAALARNTGVIDRDGINPMADMKDLPIHGGDIYTASSKYGMPVEDWIDLSTGINPIAYPFRPIPDSAYQNLPYLQPGFMKAASRFYDSACLLAVPGSQPVIQLLPEILPGESILVPEIGYQEHAQSWEKSDTKVIRYPSLSHDSAREFVTEALQRNPNQHLLVINPNNPTGIVFDVQQLGTWAAMMSPGAHLIVDEAFIETSEIPSLLSPALPSNAVVLRSFGKFFGLAGLRLGFVFARPTMLQKIADAIGLWQVNGPAQSIATQAFTDASWQRRARQTIHSDYTTTLSVLRPLMRKLGATCLTDPGLFISHILDLQTGQALYTHVANHGVLMRLVKVDQQKIILRCGILNGLNVPACERFRELIDGYHEHL